jgi:AraC-like DNA-binding protein
MSDAPRHYCEVWPSPALRPYVSVYWTWHGTDVPGTHRVLPDGCIDILFSVHRGERADTSRLRVIGTMTRHLEVSRRGVPLIVGVRFKPAGAVPFLGCPAAEITDSSLPLEDLWGRSARRLHCRLQEANSISARVEILEQALLARLTGVEARCVDRVMMEAVKRISDARGQLAVTELARDFGVSARQLRRRFDATVGVGPKRLSRIVRFQNLLETVLTGDELGEGAWASLALEAGYYDQAHLIGDFRRWTGLSPRKYLAYRRQGAD